MISRLRAWLTRPAPPSITYGALVPLTAPRRNEQ
jgi:hypothetical protein